MVIRTFVFLLINFAALGIGGIFTAKGVPSEWYQSLVKAPWTPPGWVFGAAWTLIMVCFAPFMAKLSQNTDDLPLVLILFSVQFVLNVVWNPVFFYYNYTTLGLVVISALTLLVGYFLLAFTKEVGPYRWLVLPYLIWLIIATSLNAYITFKN